MLKALGLRSSPENRSAAQTLLQTTPLGPGDIDIHLALDDPAGSRSDSRPRRWLSNLGGCFSPSDQTDDFELVPPQADFQNVARVTGHGGGVRLALHENTGSLFSAGEDAAVRVWTSEGGAIKAASKITGAHHSPIASIAVSASVRDPRAYTVAGDTTVKAWRLAEGGELAEAGSGQAGGYAKAVADMDGRVLVGLEDGRLQLLDAGAGLAPARTAEGGPPGAVLALAVLDGLCCLSAGRGSAIAVWDLRAARPVQTLEGHAHWVAALACDARRAYSGSWDGDVRAWDLRRMECCGPPWSEHKGTVAALALRPPFLFSGGADRGTKVWDCRTGRCLQTAADHAGAITGNACGPDGQLFTAACTGDIHLWYQSLSPSRGGSLALPVAGGVPGLSPSADFPSLD